MKRGLVASGILAAALAAWPAHALEASLEQQGPSLVGELARFEASVAGATGTVELRWDFGDGTRTEFTADLTEVEHRYEAAGHYPVIAVIKDDAGYTSLSFTQTVHHPLSPRRPTASTSIVHDEQRGLVWCVNPDSDSITAVDVERLEKVAEIPVYRRPEALAFAPDGRLWVVHRDDYAIAVVDADAMAIERGFRLPYASQPLGLTMSPAGDAAYVTLTATGRLLKLDPLTGDTLGELEVTPWARGVAVSHDGSDVFVTRFISAEGHASVVQIDAASWQVAGELELAEDTTTEDTDQQGRGLPNYLFSVALSPDGKEAWVPSKKDNMARGLLRDGLALTQDNTVRPLVSVLDLELGTERPSSRMDLDDRNLPSHVEFSPLGDYAFVTVTGSNLVEVRDTYKKSFVTALRSAGAAPRASVLTPGGRLFVHGFLSRDVVVYDAADILASKDFTTRKLAEIATVAVELLPPEVLLGKRVFYDSEDKRMTQEGYLSCASCHFEGFEDGRVWDFTDRGEGLRNTTSLLGRRGTGHGRVHWSGNFDEIQDFENAMRANFGGAGFIADELFAEGTRAEPLGDPKAGLSPELDALAAYVSSLEAVNPSPYRNADGTMSALALSGEQRFGELGCGTCHAEPDYTDSASGALYDVGTIKPSSGSRLGEALTGIDTPTLRGLWETAPYFHDGSAASLRDVFSADASSGEHSGLGAEQIDALVAYLLELDGELPPRLLPFEPPPRSEPPPATSHGEASCACATAGRGGAGAGVWALTALVMLAWSRRRPRRLSVG